MQSSRQTQFVRILWEHLCWYLVCCAWTNENPGTSKKVHLTSLDFTRENGQDPSHPQWDFAHPEKWSSLPQWDFAHLEVCSYLPKRDFAGWGKMRTLSCAPHAHLAWEEGALCHYSFFLHDEHQEVLPLLMVSLGAVYLQYCARIVTFSVNCVSQKNYFVLLQSLTN